MDGIFCGYLPGDELEREDLFGGDPRPSALFLPLKCVPGLRWGALRLSDLSRILGGTPFSCSQLESKLPAQGLQEDLGDDLGLVPPYSLNISSSSGHYSSNTIITNTAGKGEGNLRPH